MRPAARPTPPARSLAVTREGRWWAGVAVGLAFIGWIKTIPALLLLGYLALALLGVNVWLARRQLRGVTAARVAQPPVYVGEPVRVAVRLRNAGPKPATVGVEQPDGQPVLFDQVPPGGEAETGATRTFPKRGVVGGGSRVWSGFPLGLVRAEAAGAAGGELLVLPAVADVDLEGFRRWVRKEAGGEGRLRRSAARAAAARADLRGVRPYRPGDGLRDIHWRTTARRGAPFVREYDSAPDPELLVVVEPWLPPTPTPADAAALEAALTLAASLVRAWCLAAGTRATVAVAGGDPEVRSALPSEAAARHLLAPLAALAGTPTPAAPDLRQEGRRAARVVVSSRRGSPLAGQLAQQTALAFAAVSPADRPAWVRPRAGGPR